MDYDTHYSLPTQQQHPQRQQQQQWGPHLLQSTHPHHPGQSAFPSPVSPPLSLSDVQYQPYYHSLPQHPQQQHQQGQPLDRTSSSLSLNLSSLTMTSPTNLSPINPSPLHIHTMSHSHPGHGHAHTHSASTASSSMSPVTPISPSNSSGGLQYAAPQMHGGHHAHQANMQPYQFGMPDPPAGQGNIRYDEQPQHQFDMQGVGPSPRRGLTTTTATSSRSSSSSEVEKSVPRKRSFSANPPAQKPNNNGIATPTSLSTSLEENMSMSMFNDLPPQVPFGHAPRSSQMSRHDIRRIQMDINTPASYDEMDIAYTLLDPNSQGQGSPIDGNASPIDGGSGSGNGEGDDDDVDGDDIEGERDDQLKPLEGVGGALDMHGVTGGSMGILGKPMGTNNFVTKLYQMISDPASSRFISWTELGTSFVVSNVGEFSRSILGSHFKHNNFSSFVRQLNMYGFHKINRTPRSQRTSTDAQTWEFSHHKFLRGRPDLLDEIKRKALEPDPAIKHRVELPGEMMLMREENRRVWDALMVERRKVEKLTGVVKTLWDVVGKGFPGNVPPFPSDLLDTTESPNIYITSPTSSAPRSYLPPLSTTTSLSSLHSMSPGSSPTTAEFPTSMPPPNGPPLSRQHSFQHISYPNSRSETAVSTPLPSSPGSTSMDLFDSSDSGEGGRASSKRQRTSNSNADVNLLPNGVVGVINVSVEDTSAGGGGATGGGPNTKRPSRARSDSAPLGYGLGAGLNTGWQGTRPRSGSGLAGRGMGVGMPGVVATNRTNGGGGGNGNGGNGNGPTLVNNSPGR